MDLNANLDAFGESIYDNWLAVVPQLVDRNVNQCVLVASGGVVSVNLSSELKELMEEGKQMSLMGKENLPECLQKLMGQSDALWKLYSTLLDLCEDYNEFQRSSNSYELKLLDGEVKFINGGIEKCCSVFTWLTFDDETIVGLYERTRTLLKQIQEIQNTINTILMGIDKWGENPFYCRRDDNPKELLDLQSRTEILRTRKMECEKSKRQLSNAIEKNRQLFKVDGPETTALYEDYLGFVDGEVLNSLKWAVHQNLVYLRHEMKRPNAEPLFEVKLLHGDQGLSFSPSLDDPLNMLSKKTESFIYQIERIIGDICSVAENIPRVASGTSRNFLDELREDDDIVDVKQEIRMCVVEVIEKIKEYVVKFDKYNYLWTDDKEKILNHVEEPKIDEFRDNVRITRVLGLLVSNCCDLYSPRLTFTIRSTTK